MEGNGLELDHCGFRREKQAPTDLSSKKFDSKVEFGGEWECHDVSAVGSLQSSHGLPLQKW